MNRWFVRAGVVCALLAWRVVSPLAQNAVTPQAATPKEGKLVVRAVDERGQPISVGPVQLLQSSPARDGRRLASVLSPSVDARAAITGEVWFSSVSPGTYFVRVFTNVAPVDASGRGRLRVTYYPSALTEAGAQGITVAAGQEAAAVVRVTGGATAVSIAAVVERDAAPLPGGSISLVEWNGGTIRVFDYNRDGQVFIDNIPPGHYYIQSWPGGIGEWRVSTPVAVATENIDGVRLVPVRAATVRGRVRFDVGVPPDLRPDMTKFRLIDTAKVDPTMVDGIGVGALLDAGQWRWNPDWSFEVTGLGPGRRIVRAYHPSDTRLPTPWTIKTVTLNGQNVTDSGIDFDTVKEVTDLEIMLAYEQTEIRGEVFDGTDRRGGNYAVVLFADDPSRWLPPSRFIKAARPDAEGRFSVTGLPPGSYVAAAVPQLQAGAEYDSALLARLRGLGTPLTLAAGDTRVIDLKLVP